MAKYNSDIIMGRVVLNVNDLNKQLNFYTGTLGMTIISRDEKSADLGTEDGKALLTLNKVESSWIRSYGLYHVAYLVPTKEDLANILRHFVVSKTILDGAADHGYSNAIYLQDAENNGIEVYYDLDESTWDKREDGKIVGVTEPLDGDGLLAISSELSPYKLPIGTTVGHVHLSVQNAKVSSEFYQNILNFSDKFSVPTGSWLAHGDYHHHLAVNNWAGSSLNLRKEGTPGLAYFDILVESVETYNKLVENIIENNVRVIEQTAEKIKILDPNLIEVHLHLISKK